MACSQEGKPPYAPTEPRSGWALPLRVGLHIQGPSRTETRKGPEGGTSARDTITLLS